MKSLISLRYRRVLWGTAMAACLLSSFILTISKVPVRSRTGGSSADLLSRSAAVRNYSAASRPPQAAQPRLVESYGKLPLSFEINQGQTDPGVKFLSRGSGYSLILTGNEAVLALKKPGVRSQKSVAPAFRPGRLDPAAFRQHLGSADLGSRSSAFPTIIRAPAAEWRDDAASFTATNNEPRTTGSVLRMTLVGANDRAKVTGLDELPGKSNYFIGNDPRKWRPNVPTYAKVQYKSVYPGVDLVYYGNQQQLEYDFVVAPGADPSRITLRIGIALQPPKAHDDALVRVNANGDIVVQTGDGEVRFHKPVVYQPASDTGVPSWGGAVFNSKPKTENPKSLDGKYVLKGDDRVTFEVAPYDRSKPLIIDPVLSYSTYLGGSGSDVGQGIAVDTAGNAYVTGYTYSTDFPVANPLQPNVGGAYDIFVSKFNGDGRALVYSSYLGGSSYDIGYGITVDRAGNAYLTGYTDSPDFPTASPLQASFGGIYDAFVAKLNPTGSALVYSTYLGGSGGDYGSGVAVDGAGDAYVTGSTSSSLNFPTATAVQGTFGGGTSDAFVAKLNPTGTALLYSTYLGGTNEDSGASIAVNTMGNAYVTGDTESWDFPTASSLQGSLRGYRNAFVTELASNGSALIYSTYLGGKDYDTGLGIAVDAAGNAYLTGFTQSHDFPTASPFQGNLRGTTNAFVAKLNAKGSALIYSTYLGGNFWDVGLGIAVDKAANAYVTGLAGSPDFPTASPLQPSLNVGYDAFVAKFNPAGSALVYSTYLGGSSWEEHANGIAVDKATNAYVTGYTGSHDFPTANPLQATFGGGNYDAFVAKISPADVPAMALSNTVLAFGNQPLGTTSAPQTLTARNVGSQPLVLRRFLAVPPSWFSQNNTCQGALAPGETCTINVTFTARSKGTKKGQLIILDNSRPQPVQMVRLSGTGI